MPDAKREEGNWLPGIFTAIQPSVKVQTIALRAQETSNFYNYFLAKKQLAFFWIFFYYFNSIYGERIILQKWRVTRVHKKTLSAKIEQMLCPNVFPALQRSSSHTQLTDKMWLKLVWFEI